MENFFNIIFEDSVGFSFILHFNSQLKVKVKDISKNIYKKCIIFKEYIDQPI